MNYFPSSELVCKCGCGLNNFSVDLRDIINLIRKKLGRALVVKSACRCFTHNLAEGGTTTSDHLTGEGVDLKAIQSHTRFIILDIAFKLGIRRIGLAKNFIHLGINEANPQEVFWIY